MSFSRRLAALAAALVLPVPSRAATVVKFATLAPAGTSWMKVMGELDQEVVRETGGRVKFKFYPGGVQGDEKDVVRKIRLGQLHAAGVTGVGLGEIAPEVRILDSPFLFRDHAEVDFVLERFGGELARALEANGFVLLGWTEVGFVHLYTNDPLRSPEDMKPLKMWVWEGDPIAEAAYKAFGVQPRPLSLPDVTTSLQTGLINGVYTSHMAALGLQWFTRTKYIFSLPIAYSAGAVVVSKKLVDALAQGDRKALLEAGARHLRRLTEISRKENREALAILKKQGLKVTEPASPQDSRYEEIGRKSRRELVGRLYSQGLLDRVEKSLGEFRSSSKPPKSQPSGPGGKAKTR